MRNRSENAYRSLADAVAHGDFDAADVMLPHDLQETLALQLPATGKHMGATVDACERIRERQIGRVLDARAIVSYAPSDEFDAPNPSRTKPWTMGGRSRATPRGTSYALRPWTKGVLGAAAMLHRIASPSGTRSFNRYGLNPRATFRLTFSMKCSLGVWR